MCIRDSSSGGSLAIPVSARILEPTLFHARANSLHVEREPPPSGPIETMPLVASSRAVQILRLPGRRAGGPRLGWVETTIEPPAAELVVTGGGGGDAAAATAAAEAEAEAEEDRAIGATQLALGRDEVQGLQHRLIEVYEKVRRVSAQVAKVAPQMRMVAAIGKFGKLPVVHRVGEFFLWEHRDFGLARAHTCLLYTSPSPRDATLSRMPSSA